MNGLNEAELEALEKMLVKVGTTSLLGALADIQIDIAEHVRVNWQDEAAARTWDASTKRFLKYYQTEFKAEMRFKKNLATEV